MRHQRSSASKKLPARTTRPGGTSSSLCGGPPSLPSRNRRRFLSPEQESERSVRAGVCTGGGMAGALGFRGDELQGGRGRHEEAHTDLPQKSIRVGPPRRGCPPVRGPSRVGGGREWAWAGWPGARRLGDVLCAGMIVSSWFASCPYIKLCLSEHQARGRRRRGGRRSSRVRSVFRRADLGQTGPGPGAFELPNGVLISRRATILRF